MPSRRSILSQTVLVSVLSFGGLIAGFASSLVVAYLYGASHARDSFLLAMVIPSYVTSVFSGVFALMFTPIFIDYQTRDRQRAWQIASSVVCTSGVALSVVALAGVVLARVLASWLSPGHSSMDQELLRHLLQVMMPSVFFSGIAGLFSSLHYAEHRFAGPTIAPIVSTVVTVLVNITFHRSWGVLSLAVGVTLGSLVSASMLAVGVVGRGNLAFRFDLRDDGLRRVFRASLPLFLAGLIYRFNSGFERMIGATLPTGSISYLGYATTATMVFTALTSTGVATTIFPLLARSWAERDFPSLRRYLAIGVRTILLVALPIVAVVLVFGSTMVAVVYERGAFDHKTTTAVAWSLSLLMANYVASNLGTVVAKPFYVAQRTTFLAAYNVFETLLYLGWALVLSRRYSYLGLAAAASLRDTFSVLLYLFLVSRLFHGIDARVMVRDTLKIASSAVLLLLTAAVLRYGLTGLIAPIVVMIAATAIGGGVYGFMILRVFRIPEAVRLLDAAAVRAPFLQRWAAALRSRSSAP